MDQPRKHQFIKVILLRTFCTSEVPQSSTQCEFPDQVGFLGDPSNAILAAQVTAV